MTIATIHLLKSKQPDLLLVHLSETDSEQHGGGPFTPEAKAVLERSDELLGEMLKALPKDYAVGIVSDHGFEAVDHIANLKVVAAADGVTGEMTIAGGLVRTTTPRWRTGCACRPARARWAARCRRTNFYPMAGSRRWRRSNRRRM
jgi:predicted AlkP superfamily pyrophosphatase or phosphodiesterase